MNQFRVLANGMGWSEDNVLLPKSGEFIAYNDGRGWIDDRIKLKTIIVDGLGIGDVGPQVLSDRRKMAQSGMVVAAIPVSKDTNTVLSRAEVVTRGFVFAKTSKQLIETMKDEVEKFLPVGMVVTDWNQSRAEVQEQVEKFIFIETQREPLVEIVLVKE